MSDISQNRGTPSEGWLFVLLSKLRRQFTGAGDWKSAIADSKLPPEAQSTITTLIKQTKLMRFEKFEIADELIAHFVDGLERGKKIEELTSVFGDPDVAAALFRSSKLRSRPMAIKAGKLTFWTLLASGGSYLGLLAFFHMASPTPDIDYSVAMNQVAASVPEDERAWLVYRDAWTKFEFSEGAGERNGFDVIFEKDDEGEKAWALVRPEDKGWDRAVEKIRASSELLEAFRAGSKFDHLGLELHADISDYSKKDFMALFPNRDYETEKQNAETNAVGLVEVNKEADKLMGESLVNILLPHVQSFRHAARILRVDTRQAVTENDPDRVVENISAILGLARQQNNESILVCNLVGIAIFKIAVAQIEEVLHDSPGILQENHLSQLQNVIEKFDFTKLDFTGEETLEKDLLQRVYTDDGNGDGHLTPAGLEIISLVKDWGKNNKSGNDDQADLFSWLQQTPRLRSFFGPAFMMSSPGRREVAHQMDALREEVKLRFGNPWWEDDLSDLDQRWDKDEVSMLTLAPKWGPINASHQIAIAHQDAGLLGIAIERYRLEFDSWPQSMDDLVGPFLTTIPLDRVTGDPLLFKASDQSVTIYSVGGDRDDDGGTHDARTIPLIATTYEPSVDGDWVLWPIVRE